MNTQLEQLLSDSKVAALNSEFETALQLASEARKMEPNNPEVHKQVGMIYLLMKKSEEAIKSYTIALKYDSHNGNRYFDLGVAYASANKLPETIQYLAKADELGCHPQNRQRMYHMLGMACYELGRYDDALIYYTKEEQGAGTSLELTHRKAIIYMLKNDVTNGIALANQMKLIAPTSYHGYQVAFNILRNNKKYDLAQKELGKARKYTGESAAIYSDYTRLEMDLYQQDKDEKHLKSALTLIEELLKSVKPDINDVVKAYVSAAEIHLHMKNAEWTLRCLDATSNVPAFYNRGFKVIPMQYEEEELTDYILEEMRMNDIENVYERYGIYGIQEMAEVLESDEEGLKTFYTIIEEEQRQSEEAEEQTYKLEENIDFSISPIYKDRINELYYKAYIMAKDYEGAINAAKRMSSSSNPEFVHRSKYMEAKAVKMSGKDAGKLFESAIKTYDKAIYLDPTDAKPNILRIYSYIEIGDFEKAEHLARLLSKETRSKIEEKIDAAKRGEELDVTSGV